MKLAAPTNHVLSQQCGVWLFPLPVKTTSSNQQPLVPGSKGVAGYGSDQDHFGARGAKNVHGNGTRPPLFTKPLHHQYKVVQVYALASSCSSEINKFYGDIRSIMYTEGQLIMKCSWETSNDKVWKKAARETSLGNHDVNSWHERGQAVAKVACIDGITLPMLEYGADAVVELIF